MSFKFTSINSLVKRLDFSKLKSPNFSLPNLKGIQIDAYNNFLKNKLKEIISNYFPIKSFSKNTQIYLKDLIIIKPTSNEQDIIDKSKSYQNEIYLKVQLITEQTPGNVKITDEKIFLGNMPEFSSGSNFIINGIEKFVITQIVRSSGAYILSKSQIKLSNSRKRTQEGIICEILPLKGILMLFNFQTNKNIIKMITRSSSGENAPNFPATIFLKALGFSHDFLYQIFNKNSCFVNTLESEHYNYQDILKDKLFKAYIKEIIGAKSIEKIKESVQQTPNETLYNLLLQYLDKHGKNINSFSDQLIDISSASNKEQYTLLKEQMEKEIFSAKEILNLISIEMAAKYFVSEIGLNFDFSKKKIVSYQQLIFSYIFDKNFYDILPAGRYKLNQKLSLSNRIYKKILAQDICDLKGKIIFPKNTYMNLENINKFKELSTKNKLNITKKTNLTFINKNNIFKKNEIVYEEVDIYLWSTSSEVISIIGSSIVDTDDTINPSDFLSIISYIINIKNKIGTYDDIDHFGNKRLKLISELLENRIQLSLARINKFAVEKMNNLEARINYFSLKNNNNNNSESLFSVHSILNTKPFQIVIKEFFNSHQLTQFLDQQNPLSELTNKRKISAMGPGGIKREDPNLNIRDVHYSHYGRICPIETPEGMNIGLIMALASYAKIDKYGFLNTPYYKVVNSVITDEVHWLNAMEENDFNIVEAMSPRDANNKLLTPVVARICGNVDTINSDDVNYIDVSCNQLVSISASLIPFLEHDDANRVLMGANMQRQAVPLLKPHSPIVGTGVENLISTDSAVAMLAKSDGIVEYADGKKIVINYEGKNKEEINLMKFIKSNQNTCKNQNPLVRKNQKIKKNDLIVNGHAMENGELSIGQNLLVAFSTWHGYNYEDAIILSSRLFEEDVYTSVHIQEYSIECVRTKIGDEEITRQISGYSNEAKKYLDEDGIILVGAKVKEGDVLVGKNSPKANSDQTPEEKLLQAIFSEKARSVKDSSLKVPTGGSGIVSKVMRLSIYQGDKLDDDVIEVVKVFITQKRKIQVGDKIAGRHGNKGIVSKIARVEDMPYLEDGTPIDILLNPLGVPSRMNIGQALETYLGFAARNLVFKKLLELFFAQNIKDASKIFSLYTKDIEKLFSILKNYFEEKNIKTEKEAKEKLKPIDFSIILLKAGLKKDDIDIKVLTPVFSGCKWDDLINIMKESGLNPDKDNGKYLLYDGKTGEKFKKPIAVGIMYILKLDHMVDDKIYARSIGPYSKITQQPLGGKCQNGGQRFGEMEVWALESYGAAYNLRELLTLKSDDIAARNLIYYSIIKNQDMPTPNIPESFKLLVKQLQGIGLKINVQYGENNELISCNEFIEKQLNKGMDYLYDSEYDNDLSKTISNSNDKK